MKLTLQNYKSLNGSLSPEKMAQIVQMSGSRTFIETGTYLGETVSAMRSIFENIYSIELSEELYQQAVERFSKDEKITLLLGNSAEQLPEAVRLSADSSSIFWLDAHWSGGNTARSIENTPIVNELKAIKECQLEQPIVLIDDLRYFINIPKGFDVHEANSGYPLLLELLDQVAKLWPSHCPLIIGDLLFVFPAHIYAKLEISNVLSATHRLRFGDHDPEARRALEASLASAEGEERETIMMLPETFSHSLNYGIGGEYLYWRALIHENEKVFELARSDFQLARKCGFNIPLRKWE